MANSDYVNLGAGPFCANAVTSFGVSELQTVVPISGFGQVDGADPTVGSAALLGEEWVRVDAFTPTSVTLARGCADTIPQQHDAGTPIWFIDDDAVGYVATPYAASETVGVKILPKLASGEQVPIENSPPQSLTMNWRFARPYPPGNVKVNGYHRFTWDDETIEVGNDTLTISWAHRDRTVQMDQLVEHVAAGVGPEAGTTYEVRVYTAADVLVRTTTGITGTAWSYSRADALTDFGITLGVGPAQVDGYAVINSVRDGHESWQSYRVDFRLDTQVTPGDSLWASVVLALHCNGDHGTTTFTDSSAAANTVVANGNAQITQDGPQQAIKRIGKGAALFDGAGDYLSVDHSTNFNFTGIDWTAELWVCREAVGVAHVVLAKRGAGVAFPFEIKVGADNLLTATGTDAAGAAVFSISDTVAFNANILVHVALCKSGNDYRLFKNGVQVGSTVTSAVALGDNTDPLTIGAGAAGASSLTGRVDDVRITRSARYTSTFTPASVQFPDSL